MTTSYGAALPREARFAFRDDPVSSDSNNELVGIEQVSDLEELSELQGEWRELEQCFTTPLLSHNWFSSCAEALCASEKMNILLVRSLLKIKAIAPLSIRGGFWSRIEILGNHVTDEPSGFLFDDEQSLATLIAAMFDLRVPVYLKNLRFGSPEVKILEETVRAKGAIALVKEEALPWVRTAGTWEEFERQISSSRRSSLRRLQRQLETRGAISYDMVAPSPENADRLLSELYEVEASSWKGRAGTALKTYREIGDFFRIYARDESLKGTLRLLFLRVDGRAIAGQLAVVHSRRLWLFKIGHDESWSSYSPGVLLMHRAMKYCYEQKLEGCELLGHDEPWLHIWPTEFHGVVSYRIYHKKIDALMNVGADIIEVFSYRFRTTLAKHRRRGS